MRKRLHGFLTLFLALVVQLSFAQVSSVTGTVTDEEGMSVPGVNVIVKGTNTGAQTDFDGKFSVPAASGDVLVFSYVGFQTQEKVVGANKIINVTLAVDAAQLDEVVITAIGIERERSSLGSATTTVGSEELVRGSQSNIADALKGKVAGVNISNASTDPGASSGVIIRGISSINGSNQPLYVVNGVPINNESTFDGDLNGGYDFGRGSQDINPENIENISVLKGASATALYGSRAANGVIIITTKTGKAGKLTVDLSSSAIFSRINRTPNYQSTFGQGWDASHWLGENGSWGPRFDGEPRVWGNVVDNSQQLKPFLFQEDQLENFFTTGTYFLNDAAISGGTEKSTARLSYSNLEQDGIYPTDADSFSRNTLGLSAQTEMGFLSITGSLNYVNTGGSAVATGQGISAYNNLLQIPTDLNISGFKDYNNKFNNVSNYYTPYGITNPYFSLNESGTDYAKERVYGSMGLTANINEWSKITYRFGLDQYSERRSVWEAIVSADPGSPNAGSSTEQSGSYFERNDMVKQLNHDLLYDIDLDISDNFRIQTTTGFNVNSRRTSYLTAEVGSQNIPGFYSLSNSGEDPSASSYTTERKLFGLYNNTTLSFLNSFFLTGNIRNDWYSTLPTDNRSVLYGGINSSWVFTRTFEGLTGFLNYGKLRAGYGEVGVDTNPYQILPDFVSGNADNQGFGNLSFPLGGVNAYEVGNRAANPGLKPERRKEFEVGAELEFFSNRISIDFTYYNATVENQILSLPLSASSGFTNQTANLGTISNEGIEALLKFSLFRNPDGFNWDTSLNFAQNNSVLEELDPRIEQVSLGGLANITLVARPGQPLALIEGSVPQLTPDGRMIVDANGIPIASSTKEVYGDTQYDYTLGVSNEFSYKNISLGFTLDVREGGLMYSRTADITRFTGNSITTTYNDREPFIAPNSVQQEVEDDGTISYVENTIPVGKDYIDDYYSATAFDRQTVIDKSFIKLREVVFSYGLPSKLLEKTPLDALSVSVIGRNLFLWTPESNQFIDPEASTFGTDLESQFGEFSANPSTRSIGMSIKTRF